MFAEQWEQAPWQRVPQASVSAPSEIGGKTYNSQAQIRCGMETSRWEESRARICQDRKPAASSRDTQSLLGTMWVPCVSLLPFSNRTLSSQQLWTNANRCGRSQLLDSFSYVSVTSNSDREVKAKCSCPTTLQDWNQILPHVHFIMHIILQLLLSMQWSFSFCSFQLL